ncbi:hypothetical protein [Phenylobacterium sp.]|uniref:hypothetical protein n=1 Tax=Phenylobacterium sp. TaxID=1871053 RepID=UPI003D2A533F
MTNNEPPWEQTRTRVDNRLDGVLLLPWFGDFGGVLDSDPGTIGFGLMVWLLAVVIWTPWIVLRVRMSRPTGDTARAAAVLGLGLLPWVVAVPLTSAPITLAGALIGFPLMYLWGAGAMAAAALQWPARLPPRRRTAILVAGGLSYAVVAAGLLLFLLADIRIGARIVTPILVLLSGATALAAVMVLLSAQRPWTPYKY